MFYGLLRGVFYLSVFKHDSLVSGVLWLAKGSFLYTVYFKHVPLVSGVFCGGAGCVDI